MKGPQHINLEDYSSKCKFGLYINQEDQEMKSSIKNNKSISSNKKQATAGELGLFKSCEGVYPYSTYDIRDTDIDKMAEPK